MASMMTGDTITGAARGQMKAYAARDYLDDKYRKTNYVRINIPEYNPTTPQDDEYTNLVIPAGYFVNDNYPVTQDTLKCSHAIELPLQKGSIAPVCFHKGAEFLVIYPTGKLEDGTLVFVRDKESS